MFMGWQAFSNDVWQQASTMTVAGFRFPTGIATEQTVPSNNLREMTIADGEGRSIGDKAFQVFLLKTKSTLKMSLDWRVRLLSSQTKYNLLSTAAACINYR